MDLTGLTEMIQSVGFPIVCCGGLFWYMYKQDEKHDEQVKELLTDGKKKPIYICGNSLNIDKLVNEKYDMVFSCPPYFDLEKYSDDKNDLSNLDYEDFKKQYAEIICKSVEKLKEDRFAVFVVGEVRNKKNGIYRNFVSQTIDAFTSAGTQYYNEIILVNMSASGGVRAPKQFNTTRKVVKTHQNVLVFYKGNPKNIKDEFGEVKVKEIDETELNEEL